MVLTLTFSTSQNTSRPAATIAACRLNSAHTLPAAPELAIVDDSTITRPMPVSNAVTAKSRW